MPRSGSSDASLIVSCPRFYFGQAAAVPDVTRLADVLCDGAQAQEHEPLREACAADRERAVSR